MSVRDVSDFFLFWTVSITIYFLPSFFYFLLNILPSFFPPSLSPFLYTIYYVFIRILIEKYFFLNRATLGILTTLQDSPHDRGSWPAQFRLYVLLSFWFVFFGFCFIYLLICLLDFF